MQICGPFLPLFTQHTSLPCIYVGFSMALRLPDKRPPPPQPASFLPSVAPLLRPLPTASRRAFPICGSFRTRRLNRSGGQFFFPFVLLPLHFETHPPETIEASPLVDLFFLFFCSFSFFVAFCFFYSRALFFVRRGDPTPLKVLSESFQVGLFPPQKTPPPQEVPPRKRL